MATRIAPPHLRVSTTADEHEGMAAAYGLTVNGRELRQSHGLQGSPGIQRYSRG